MKLPHVPPYMVADLATLKNRLTAAGEARGITPSTIAKVMTMLPTEILDSPCFLCRLTGLWRYEFGNPIDRLPGGQIVIGTHMFIPVDRLLDVLLCADQRIDSEKRQRYIARLADPDKHQDVLAEMLPIIRLDPNIEAEFEVVGQGAGNRTLDWSIRPQVGPPILVDVKYRTRDLIEGFAQIARGERRVNGSAPMPRHDTAILFRNTVEKFEPRDPTQYLQGAWIVTELKQERSELHGVFDSLDHSRLHFAVITNWRHEAYILARQGIDTNVLVDLFHLQRSEQCVFQRVSND